MLGLEEGEARQAKFLGRTIRARESGIEVEADGRLVKGLLEEYDPDSTKVVDTPGMKLEEDEMPKPFMSAGEAHKFRRGAAKLNYLAQDRADLSFASKEISRGMSSPAVADEVLLTRAVRYLRKYPSWSFQYRWQHTPINLVVFTDSDWGGCRKTRRSTSGGAVMHGGHLIMHWSRTQQLVALSSAEAELNASIKAAQEALGLRQMATEVGMWCTGTVEVRGDSSANDGILKRAGSGKIKHLTVRQLWLQEKCELGIAKHVKIPRAINSVDAMTHHFTKVEAETHLGATGCCRAVLD